MVDIGRQIAIARSSLQRMAGIRDFLRVVPDSSSPSGYGFQFIAEPGSRPIPTIAEAVQRVEQTIGITDYRQFGVAGAIIGSTKGASHIAEEARVLNTLLSSDPRTEFNKLPQIPSFDNVHQQVQERLRRLGLGEFIDSQMTVEFAKFNYPGGPEAVQRFMDTPFGQGGMLNVSDEGVTLMRYKRIMPDGTEQILDNRTMSRLQYALGLGSLNEGFYEKLLAGNAEKVGKELGKIPKRYRALYNIRGYSLAGEELESALDRFSTSVYDLQDKRFDAQIDKRAKELAKRRGLTTPTQADMNAAYGEIINSKQYKDFIARNPYRGMQKTLSDSLYQMDTVGTFLKGLFDMDSIGVEDRYLLGLGMDVSHQDLLKFSYMNKGQIARGRIPKKILQNLKEEVKAYTQITSDEDIENFITRLGNDYNSAGGNIKDLESIIKGIDVDGALEEDVLYAKRVQAVLGGVEKSTDGQILTNRMFWRSRIEELQDQLRNIKGSITGPVDAATNQKMKEIQSEIEALRYKMNNMRSQTIRGAASGASIKAEDIAVDFSKMPGALKEMVGIVYDSSMKKEISQGLVESILMDISTSASKPVQIDPLMLMYHPDYFESGEMFENMRINAERSVRNIEQFMETGIAPKGFVEQIAREAQEDVEQYTGYLKAQRSRAKAQAQEIHMMLMAGQDIRSIPAAVARISDQFATEAFKEKNGKILLTMPDVKSAQIRTTRSAGITNSAVSIYSPVKINPNQINVSHDVRTSFGAVGRDTLNFMEYEMRDGTMLINPASAHLYHHALGTFDLDDKALNGALTFKDANGKSRLAFMTGRQPTGSQEKIFSRTDFAKKENVASIMKIKAKDHIEMINEFLDPSINSSLNLSARDQEILTQIQGSLIDLEKKKKLKGKIQVGGQDVDTAEVEDLVVRIRESAEAKRYGLTSLKQMNDIDMLEMLGSGSASPLGLDKVIYDRATGKRTPISELYAKIGLNIDDAPFYTQGRVFNAVMQGAELAIDDQMIDILTREHDWFGQAINNARSLNPDATLNDILTGHFTELELAGDVTTKEDRIIETMSAYDTVIRDVQARSVTGDKPIGMYINRQGVAVSTQPMIDSIIADRRLSGQMINVAGQNYSLDDYMRLRFSIGLVPPSEAVDAAKELVAKQVATAGSVEKAVAYRVLEAEQMKNMFVALNDIVGSGNVPADVVENMFGQILENYAKVTGTKFESNLDLLGQAAVKSSAQQVGFMQAQQMLTGFADQELAGFDPALLFGNMERVKTSEEALKLRDAFLQGLRERVEIAEVEGIYSDADIQRVKQKIASIELVEDKEELSKLLGMTRGSEIHRRFATTDNYNPIALEVQRKVQGASMAAYRQSQLMRPLLAPKIDANLQLATDEFVGSYLRTEFDQLKGAMRERDLLVAKGESHTLKGFYVNQSQMNIGTELYDFMRVLADEKNASILDVYETMESSISKIIGTEGLSALKSSIFSETADDQLRR